MKDSMVLLKNEIDDINIDYELLSPFLEKDYRNRQIQQRLLSVDEQLVLIDKKVEILNGKIDNLTNHADGTDYKIAIASGVIAGLIDSFVVGKWDFENAKGISNKDINGKIMEAARKEGYKGDRLSGAIEKLEKKFKLPGDNAWSGKNLGINSKSHHLDDFSHHPTPIGLICAILAQFTEIGRYANSDGKFIEIPIEVNERNKLVGNTLPTKVFCGIINWCVDVVKTKENWQGHLMSDMAGSNKKAGFGMGIPGPIMSMLKELSSLPIVNDTDFTKKLSDAFIKGIGVGKGQLDLGVFNNLFEGASSKVDSRTEKAIGYELKRQAMPVVINECLVRGFYFVRKLVMELKEKGSFNQIDWKAMLPFKNRTVIRMLTISTGTFMAVDLADATIRAAIETEGFNPATAGAFIVRVNFVGVGRFSFAAICDVGMGIKKTNKMNEKIELVNQQLNLLNAKLFYKQANSWIAAEATEISISEAQEELKNALFIFYSSWKENEDDLEKIKLSLHDAEEKNIGLSSEIIDILTWEG